MIYFMQPENGGPIKIGFAIDPKKRLIGIQVNHYEQIVLRCVMEGDRQLEADLHARFAYCWRIGEWFEPVPELLEIMATLPKLDWINRRGQHLEAHPKWKGRDAGITTKHSRIRRGFALGPCERCGRRAFDRKPRDGDHDNLAPENIAFYCRKCSMVVDGRMGRFVEMAKAGQPRQPPKPCANCDQLSKPLSKGRCHTCDAYYRRKGTERPISLFRPLREHRSDDVLPLFDSRDPS